MFNHVIQKVSAELSIDVAEHRSILRNKGVRISIISHDRPMFNHIIPKASARAFH